MNVHDSERIAGLLEAEGMQATEELDAADVVVLNTCCIRENADNKLYGNLGQLKALKERKPGLRIAVGGCLAQKDRGLIQDRAPHTDVVFGTHNTASVVDLLRRSEHDGAVMEVLEESHTFPSALPARRDLPYSAWVTIQIGCDNRCAFCIVPAVRGREISRPPGDRGRGGVADCHRRGGGHPARPERELLRARDLTRRRPLFAELLRAVGAMEGIERVRFTSPHPKDLRPQTAAAMGDTPTVCEHLHLPLQSGSDRVLAAMHRGYTAERYLEKLATARAAVADLAVSTDIIVGFPGETDDDFERTLEVVAAAEYDSAYTFVFSPRPGTEAAGFADRFVPPAVAAERFARLTVVVERSALHKHQARVGRTERVLVEGPSRKDAAVLTGRTRQNKLVHFAAEPLSPGTFARVRVTAAAPHHLLGDLVEVTARPRHKTRIPVAAL